MAKERLSMRKIKEILRLKFDCDLTDRQIAKSCSVARSTVAKYISGAEDAGLTWPIPENLNDTDVYNLVFKEGKNKSVNQRNMPPMEYIHNELKKRASPFNCSGMNINKTILTGISSVIFANCIRNGQKSWILL